MAGILQTTLGRNIAFRQEDIKSFAAARARRKGFNPRQTDELIAMYRHYGDFGLPGNGRVLEMLLGHASRNFDAVVRREYRRSEATP